MRRADLIALAQSTGFPRISIYLPTHLTYPEIEQDPIRLSNLLKQADEQLEAAGVRRPEIDELLEEARGRVPASMFWRYQEHGLAVLIEKGKTHWVKLPRSVPELVVLSPRYHLRPMIPMFRNGENFNLLAVSRENIRFYRGRERELVEVAVENMPSGMTEIRQRTEYDDQLGFHARDRGDPARIMKMFCSTPCFGRWPKLLIVIWQAAKSRLFSQQSRAPWGIFASISPTGTSRRIRFNRTQLG